MNLMLKILIGVAAWHVIGAAALAAADDEAGHLYQWVSRAPYGLDMLCLTVWPVIIYFYRFSK